MDNDLFGVAATSPTNAWAVGSCDTYLSLRDRTLIESWNGTAWKRQPSPSRDFAGLSGVPATSSTNAWAVGSYTRKRFGRGRTLALHWNGTAWRP